jgi:hypothetical protein
MGLLLVRPPISDVVEEFADLFLDAGALFFGGGIESCQRVVDAIELFLGSLGDCFTAFFGFLTERFQAGVEFSGLGFELLLELRGTLLELRDPRGSVLSSHFRGVGRLFTDGLEIIGFTLAASGYQREGEGEAQAGERQAHLWGSRWQRARGMCFHHRWLHGRQGHSWFGSTPCLLPQRTDDSIGVKR